MKKTIILLFFLSFGQVLSSYGQLGLQPIKHPLCATYKQELPNWCAYACVEALTCMEQCDAAQLYHDDINFDCCGIAKHYCDGVYNVSSFMFHVGIDVSYMPLVLTCEMLTMVVHQNIVLDCHDAHAKLLFGHLISLKNAKDGQVFYEYDPAIGGTQPRYFPGNAAIEGYLYLIPQ